MIFLSQNYIIPNQIEWSGSREVYWSFSTVTHSAVLGAERFCVVAFLLERDPLRMTSSSESEQMLIFWLCAGPLLIN
jgi:hypothetical protein